MSYTIKPKKLVTEYLYVFVQYPEDVGGQSYEFRREDGLIRITDSGVFREIYLKSVIKLLKKARKEDPALSEEQEFDWITNDTESENIPTFAVNLFEETLPQDYLDEYKYVRFVCSRVGDLVSVLIMGYSAFTFRTWELKAFLKALNTIQKSLEPSE